MASVASVAFMAFKAELVEQVKLLVQAELELLKQLVKVLAQFSSLEIPVFSVE